MKNLLIVLFSIIALNAVAQIPKDIYSSDFESRKILPNQHIREADVLWSKTVWRMVDLRQKKNHSLYFPTEPTGRYKSLSHVLMELIRERGVNIYDENLGDEFSLSVTQKDVEERMGKKEDVIMIDDPLTDEVVERKITTEYEASDIKRYLIKEVWFFDRNQAKIDVRIVGICPVREYYREDDIDREEPKFKKVGWFYFPEIEKYLIRYPSMNGANEAWKWTYYDVFKHRFFESIIVQVGNVYNNRPISDYAIGTEALVESQRIEEEIRNFELDLWNY